MATPNHPLLPFFEYAHLKEPLRNRSRPFYSLVLAILDDTELDPVERDYGLRKLLEAKDCIVRAALPQELAMHNLRQELEK